MMMMDSTTTMTFDRSPPCTKAKTATSKTIGECSTVQHTEGEERDSTRVARQRWATTEEPRPRPVFTEEHRERRTRLSLKRKGVSHCTAPHHTAFLFVLWFASTVCSCSCCLPPLNKDNSRVRAQQNIQRPFAPSVLP